MMCLVSGLGIPKFCNGMSRVEHGYFKIAQWCYIFLVHHYANKRKLSATLKHVQNSLD